MGRGENGDPAKKRRPTLRDVAARAGVDPSAVSRHINGDPHLSVSAETRARIDAAVKALDYRPNQAARGLKLAKSWLFGLVVPDLSNPMYQSVAQGASEQANKLGYGLVLSGSSIGQVEKARGALLDPTQVEGLLVASGGLDDELVRSLGAKGHPVVVVNRRVEGVAGVVLDDERGSEMATEHLLERGHRRIGLLLPPGHYDTAQRRREGMERAVARVPGARAAVVSCDGWTHEAGYAGFERLMREAPETTAVYAASLVIGIGLAGAARDMGMRIPADLSVICLHDAPILEYFQPPLSTVRMPSHMLGSAAVNLLVDLIEGGPSRSLMVEGEIAVVDRGSVAAPRTG